jgi:hypothetical protein
MYHDDINIGQRHDPPHLITPQILICLPIKGGHCIVLSYLAFGILTDIAYY